MIVDTTPFANDNLTNTLQPLDLSDIAPYCAAWCVSEVVSYSTSRIANKHCLATLQQVFKSIYHFLRC